MDSRQMNEWNLRTLFCWVDERYPSLVSLTVNGHSDLATVETPDGKELLHDSDETRLKAAWVRATNKGHQKRSA